MKNLEVKNYELRSEQVIALVTDGKTEMDQVIDRTAFEHWLTDGTGMVDMSITHHDGDVITEVPIEEPVNRYWLQGAEINDSPVLEHISMYLRRDQVAISALKAEFAEEHLKGLFAEMEPVVRAEAYAFLLEYGMLQKEYGEQSASVVFRKILTSNAA
jgi:hypothetical protein